MQEDFEGISVCTMSMDAVPESMWRRLLAILDPAEQQRAARFAFERHRRQFTAAHVLKRAMLTDAAGGRVAPPDWRFESATYGKPRISGIDIELHFSLSHCEGAVACAVSHRTEVGIDVECLNQSAPLELAESHFAPSECAWLKQQPVDRRPSGFFQLWTLKEAYVKATGRGLSQRFGDFAFQFEPLRLTFDDPSLGNPDVWRFEQKLIDAQRYVMALAWREGPTPAGVRMTAVHPEALL